jgi:hypothetical protein
MGVNHDFIEPGLVPPPSMFASMDPTTTSLHEYYSEEPLDVGKAAKLI